MEHYFEVILNYDSSKTFLVKAHDVMEAGLKFGANYLDVHKNGNVTVEITEITRTNIIDIIE